MSTNAILYAIWFGGLAVCGLINLYDALKRRQRGREARQAGTPTNLADSSNVINQSPQAGFQLGDDLDDINAARKVATAANDLEQAATKVAATKHALEAAEKHQQDRIRRALDAGMKPAAIAKLTGITAADIRKT